MSRPNGTFGTGTLCAYESFDQVGEGTYGYVYKARDKRNGDVIALKRLIFHKESAGFPLCAVREVKFLKSLAHKNIVKLKDIVTSKGCEYLDIDQAPKISVSDKNNFDASGSAQNHQQHHQDNKSKDQDTQNNRVVQLCGNLYLVFEYVEHDLGGLIDAKHKFSRRSVKCIMKQLFEVLDYLSEKKIIHRDIKSSNILISNHHHVKLADFGLARSFVASDGREGQMDLTNNVVTMWYRAPELLLGSVRYTNSVDTWSAGCVMAELELGRPFLPGRSEVEQMEMICKLMGTPSEDIWSDIALLPNYDMLIRNNPQKHTGSLRAAYQNKLSDQVINLLERVLVLDPRRRTSPRIALASNAFFCAAPLPPSDPTELEPLSSSGSSYHEYQTKMRRKQSTNAPVQAMSKETDRGGEVTNPSSASAAAAGHIENATTASKSAVATTASLPPPSAMATPSAPTHAPLVPPSLAAGPPSLPQGIPMHPSLGVGGFAPPQNAPHLPYTAASGAQLGMSMPGQIPMHMQGAPRIGPPGFPRPPHHFPISGVPLYAQQQQQQQQQMLQQGMYSHSIQNVGNMHQQSSSHGIPYSHPFGMSSMPYSRPQHGAQGHASIKAQPQMYGGGFHLTGNATQGGNHPTYLAPSVITSSSYQQAPQSREHNHKKREFSRYESDGQNH